jgi:hypothetical protein
LRLRDERVQGRAFAAPADGCDRRLEPGGVEIACHDRERSSFEGGAASWSGVATQPVEAALGRYDE